MSTPTSRIFHSLLGNYRLQRTIKHTDSSMNGRAFEVSGTASFSTTGPAEYLYEESGTMIERNTGYEPTIGNLSATKRYWYRYAERSDEIAIFFDDRDGNTNRLFHKLQVLVDSENKASCASGSHLCGSDMYNADYVFGDDQLTIEYRVDGPNKKYTSQTNLTLVKCMVA